ncbi:hypothetical protein RRG08_023351 [Elysia crispata]|uniref:AIG1-type G domain-containing protein n=1 Tax=Elysia crispata TaxID=231223 RepID=A0AAE1BD04_9GAST|nr:hypothetical protein RRG08_023351 [Elysia crispata]
MASSIPAVNVHLIGKQGSGKSATGNSILQKKAFRTALSGEAVTVEFKTEAVSYGSHRLFIWDGPGVTENQKQTVEIVKNMHDTVYRAKTEHHVLLWVIRYGEQCSVVDEYLLKQLTKTFGEKFLKANSAVIVTFKDSFDSDVEECGLNFESWMYQQTGFFKKLCQMCEYKVVPINNRKRADEQIQNLLPFLLKTSEPIEVITAQQPQQPQQPQQLTVGNSTRELPEPQTSGRGKQDPATLYSGQAMLRDDDRGILNLKTHIDELIHILSKDTQKTKLASLEKIRNKLETCNLTEKGHVLEAVRREVEREIAMCQASMRQDHQTKQYMNRLRQLLQSSPNDLGPLA